MIAIIDYGMGNTHSICSMLNHLEQRVVITHDPEQLHAASHLILPGVGAFNRAMQNLQKKDLIGPLQDEVNHGKPMLGICLGMQLLGNSSTEVCFTHGLGWIDGDVSEFEARPTAEVASRQKIPHVGFNDIEIDSSSRLLRGLPTAADFYFTHSYRMQCADDNSVSSYAVNGERFVASVERDNIFGTQFHPELSQNNGLQLMRNFIAIS